MGRKREKSGFGADLIAHGAAIYSTVYNRPSTGRWPKPGEGTRPLQHETGDLEAGTAVHGAPIVHEKELSLVKGEVCLKFLRVDHVVEATKGRPHAATHPHTRQRPDCGEGTI